MMHSVNLKSVFVLFACVLTACGTEFSSSSADDTDPVFLVQKPVDGERAVMEALYEGKVVEIDDCLRLGDEPDSHTVVWPPGFSLDRQGEADVVLDENGAVVGEVGTFFRLGGGAVTTLGAGALSEAMRTAALNQCPGRYWLVGEIL